MFCYLNFKLLFIIFMNIIHIQSHSQLILLLSIYPSLYIRCGTSPYIDHTRSNHHLHHQHRRMSHILDIHNWFVLCPVFVSLCYAQSHLSFTSLCYSLSALSFVSFPLLFSSFLVSLPLFFSSFLVSLLPFSSSQPFALQLSLSLLQK